MSERAACAVLGRRVDADGFPVEVNEPLGEVLAKFVERGFWRL